MRRGEREEERREERVEGETEEREAERRRRGEGMSGRREVVLRRWEEMRAEEGKRARWRKAATGGGMGEESERS